MPTRHMCYGDAPCTLAVSCRLWDLLVAWDISIRQVLSIGLRSNTKPWEEEKIPAPLNLTINQDVADVIR